MYRENTFEVLKNRHDNFNFAKVLQKRKEFYNQLSDKSGKNSSKISYNNDNFIHNINDKFLVSEITGGEPTYHNQKLFDNLRK